MTTQNPEVQQGVIITDCADENARARLQVKFSSLFGIEPIFIGVEGDDADLTAAGHLVDILYAREVPAIFDPGIAVILLNVARRGGSTTHKGGNGTPFCYAQVGNTTVVSTYEGRTLSLASKLKLISTVKVLDIPEIANKLMGDGILSEAEAKQIIETQFRSLLFQPLAARLLVNKTFLPAEEVEPEATNQIAGRAWLIDIFGNIKTTVLPAEVSYEPGKMIVLTNGTKVMCYPRLADIPIDKLGATIGSSGYGEHRWIELAVQRGRASDELGFKVGSQVLELVGDTSVSE